MSIMLTAIKVDRLEGFSETMLIAHDTETGLMVCRNLEVEGKAAQWRDLLPHLPMVRTESEDPRDPAYQLCMAAAIVDPQSPPAPSASTEDQRSAFIAGLDKARQHFEAYGKWPSLPGRVEMAEDAYPTIEEVVHTLESDIAEDRCPVMLAQAFKEEKRRIRCVLRNGHDGQHAWPSEAMIESEQRTLDSDIAEDRH